MFTRKFIAPALAAAALALSAVPASAALFQGALSFSGDIGLTSGDTLASIDALSFINDDFDVDGAEGDFAAAGIGQGDLGAITDFDFALSTVDGTTLSINDIDFTLTSVEVLFQSTAFLLIQGTGFITATGFDQTAADFVLTANTNGQLEVMSGSISAVPVPGALWLMGSALVALGARRRK